MRLQSSGVLTGTLGDADLGAVLVDSEPDAGADALAVLLHDEHHVADVDGRLGRHDAAGLGPTSGLSDLRVLLDPVDALDDDLVVLGEGLDDATRRALVLARDHENAVALLDAHVRHLRSPPVRAR